MSPHIDMGDQNAWDDSILISSWDDAVTEYKKYHSIHKSGMRLEDVLTKEELQGLRGDYEDLLEEGETPLHSATVDHSVEQTGTESAGDSIQGQSEPHQKTAHVPQKQTPPAIATDQAIQIKGPVDSVPQALLGSVQDENLKNIMMSWYYAGYYTGLHAGQQTSPGNGAPSQ